MPRVGGPAVPLETSDDCAGMWFEALRVDGQPAGAFSIGQVIFNSTSVTDALAQPDRHQSEQESWNHRAGKRLGGFECCQWHQRADPDPYPQWPALLDAGPGRGAT